MKVTLHLMNKVTFDDGFARYALNGKESAPGHRHPHASCTGCGSVCSLETELLDSLGKEVLEKLGSVGTDREVKLYGLCSECRKKNQRRFES